MAGTIDSAMSVSAPVNRMLAVYYLRWRPMFLRKGEKQPDR
jgi:hypothetical protein